MNQYEFESALKKIIDVFPSLPNATTEVLRDQYMNLDAGLWKRICSHVLLKNNFVPRPVKFEEARTAVVGDWRKGRPSQGCNFCDGVRFVDAYFTVDGIPCHAHTPCRCNPLQLQGRARTSDKVSITYPEYRRLKGLRVLSGDENLDNLWDLYDGMGPVGACTIMDLMDNHKTYEMPQRVIEALAMKACEPEKSVPPQSKVRKVRSIGSVLKTALKKPGDYDKQEESHQG